MSHIELPRILLVCTLAAVLGPGAVASAAEAPRFLIESIAVEGTRYSSAAVVEGESRIRKGASYSEDELRDAAARVNHLPFVLHTDFRLDRGTERGRYALVIAVEEAKPLFFGHVSTHGAASTLRLEQIVFDPATEEWTPEFRRQLLRYTDERSTIGARWFNGRQGMLYASADREEDSDRYNLGYTQYGLLRRGASLSLLLQYREVPFAPPPLAEGPKELSHGDHLAIQVAAAVPIASNQALRATWYRQTDPFVYLRTTPGGGDGYRITKVATQRAELDWRLDTTDDPLFTTRGTLLQVAMKSETVHQTVTRAAEPTFIRSRWRHDAAATAAKYWELTPLQSISAGAEAATVDGRQHEEVRLRAGYAATLWQRPFLRGADLRFETGAERVILRYDDTSSYGTVHAGVAWRSAWGTLRLDFQYLGWRQLPR